MTNHKRWHTFKKMMCIGDFIISYPKQKENWLKLENPVAWDCNEKFSCSAAVSKKEFKAVSWGKRKLWVVVVVLRKSLTYLPTLYQYLGWPKATLGEDQYYLHWLPVVTRFGQLFPYGAINVFQLYFIMYYNLTMHYFFLSSIRMTLTWCHPQIVI